MLAESNHASHLRLLPFAVVPYLPPHGNRSDGCTHASGLQKPSSIALLTPDSHGRHVCRCYAGTWLVSPRCTYHGRLGFARFRKGWRSLQGLNL